MAKPRGIEHLVNYLGKQLEDHYVIIGSGAAAVVMEEKGLEFRTTKDIDIVLLLKNSELLRGKILSYIREGEYETNGDPDKPRYYRFSRPKNKDFPEIVEFFAQEGELSLVEGQRIVPICDNDNMNKISAILLDDEYFNLIVSNCVISRDGIPVISAVVNICLKAGAYRDLSIRRQEGKMDVDSKDIVKHLKDAVRLTLSLTVKEQMQQMPLVPKVYLGMKTLIKGFL